MHIKASIERETNTVAKFAMLLLNAVTVTHVMHLSTRSYAQHRALGDFYDELGDAVDKFVECYQGKYSAISNWGGTFENQSKDPTAYLTMLGEKVEEMRRQSDFPQDSSLQNEVDEIVNLISRTLYKLRYLS